MPLILSTNSWANGYLFEDITAIFNDTIQTVRPISRPPEMPTRPLSDSLPLPQDSILQPIDSASQDSTREKQLFNDVVSYHGEDSVTFSIAEKRVYLYGKGSFVKYINTEVTADYIVLDMEKKEAFATGSLDSAGSMVGTPVFKDGGQSFEGKELRYNFDTKKGFVKDIIMQEGEGYIQGKLTKKQTDSIYCMKHGTYTTCDCHDHPHFEIRMDRAKMIKDKKVFATWTHLRLEDVPLPIVLPFVFFPITEKGTSGIIMPTYGEERLRGFNLRNGGYYFYINDYIDAAVTGDIYTNGSWALRVDAQYVKRYRYKGTLNLSTSKNFEGEKGLPDYRKSGDWSVKWTHSQDAKANPYSTFSASVDISSSTNNQYNYQTMNDIANQRKQSSITWSKKWPNSPFSLNGSLRHNQNSRDTSISLTLPNLSIRMTQLYPFRKKGKAGNLKWYDNIGVSYSGEITNSINTKESLLMKSSFYRDWQNGYKHSIPVSFSFKISKDITFAPTFNYTGYLNLKTMEKIWLPDTTRAGGKVITREIEGINYSHQYSTSFSIGWTPTIYGMFDFKPESNIKAIRHMIRPSFSFSYTPPIGPLGDYTKTYFNGREEVEYSIYDGMTYRPTSTKSPQSGNISLSIDNNVEMKMRHTRDTTAQEGNEPKVKLLESLSISASYNIFADSLNLSNISLSARTKVIRDKIDINISASIDPYALDINGRKINKFHGGLGRLVSASITSGFSFSSDNGKNKEEKNELVGGYYDNYVDFDVPWSISMNYSMSYSKSGLSKATIQQTMNFNGNLALTPKWQLTFSSGYDITNKEITMTNFGLSRDLHCWEMTFNCQPFGRHQSYNFQINVRSSMLRDLKLTKRGSWYDR